jgi:formylglycine-generating enzyme required for sulfatase activity
VALRVHTLSEPELQRVASNAIDTANATAWYKLGNDPAHWFEGLTPFGSLLAQPGYGGVQTRGDTPRYYRIANRDQVRYFQRRIQAWSENVAPPDASAHFGPRDWTPPTGFQPIGLAQIADAGVYYPSELRNTVDGSRFVLVTGTGAPFYIQAFEVGAGDWRRYLETLEGKAQITQGDAAVAKAEEPAGLAKEYAKLTPGQKQAARYFLPENELFFGLGVAERGVSSVGKRIKPARLSVPQRTATKPHASILAVVAAQAASGPKRVNPEPVLPENYARVFEDLAVVPAGKPARGILPLDTFGYAAWIGGDADVRLPTDAEWRAALPAAQPGLIGAPLLPTPAVGMSAPLGAKELADAARDRSWCGAHGLRGNAPEWTLAEAPAAKDAQVEMHLRGFAWDDDGTGAEDPHDAAAGDTAETGYWRAGFRLVLVPQL